MAADAGAEPRLRLSVESVTQLDFSPWNSGGTHRPLTAFKSYFWFRPYLLVA
jgi:hypothetical protein